MTAFISPAAEGTDFFIPHFEVKLVGKELDPIVVSDVMNVSYHDSLKDVDGFELTLANGSLGYAVAGGEGFKYSDSHLFDPGKQIELRLGYLGGHDLESMITGDITSLTPSFPASGLSTLKVSGLNVLHRLRKKQRSVAYRNMTDGQIAEQIAQSLGVHIDPDHGDGETHEYIFQDKMYDAVFLITRGHAIGYEVTVVETPKGTVIHYGESGRLKDYSYHLSYGASLISFEPTLSTARQVEKVTFQGWHGINRQKITATSNLSEIHLPSQVPDLAAAVRGREEVISDRPVASAVEANNLVQDTHQRIVKELITARATTIGLPKLRAGSAVYIDGVGDRYSGRYFVTGTTHTMGESGYTTQFECRREDG
jgi:phage protein D